MTAAGAGVRTVGILGGTGPQGRGLGRRLASAGYQVVLGSRSVERAQAVAATYSTTSRASSNTSGTIQGASNEDAAETDLVIVAVPYQSQAPLLTSLAEPLAGKIVVNCVNPIGFDGKGPYPLPVPAGSAAQEAQQLLPDSVVVGAFHHVSAVLLEDPAVDRIAMDVLVLGEDRAAVQVVCDLATALPGARGIYAGRLRNAGQVEAFTANLIAMNRRYHTHAGLAITGIE